MVYSSAVTDGFIRDTEEVNARISPTRIVIEQSSSHVYLVQILKRESVFMSALCTLYQSSCHLLLAAIINSRPPSVPNRATCGSKTELARCTETKYRPELGHPLSTHWATPPFSERCSSLLKRVQFGYGSLINLFSTTPSIQANSRVRSLSVSAKRKPVHSFHGDVTTKI